MSVVGACECEWTYARVPLVHPSTTHPFTRTDRPLLKRSVKPVVPAVLPLPKVVAAEVCLECLLEFLKVLSDHGHHSLELHAR
jgi:hypothetical protein